MNIQDKIVAEIELCDRHAEHLLWTINEIEKLLPFSAEKLAAVSQEKRAMLDMFMNRFSKLQDTMGAKLFPMVLELTEEPGEYPTFLDKLHRLQKMEAIPESFDWRELRKTRNYFSHDYVDEDHINAGILNTAYKQAKTLLDVFQGLKKFVEKYNGS